MVDTSPLAPAELALLGTLAGAVIGSLGSSWFGEYYKRYRDTKATAYALSGELTSHIEAMSDEVLTLFRQIAVLAAQGKFGGLPDFEAFDSVYDENISKLGLLGGDIPKRLVTTYGRIKAGRQSPQNMTVSKLSLTDDQVGATVKYYHLQWTDHIKPDGLKLIGDLDRIGAKGFWRTLFT